VLSLQTSDVTVPHAKLQHNLILVSGFKRDYGADELPKHLPGHVSKLIYNVSLLNI